MAAKYCIWKQCSSHYIRLLKTQGCSFTFRKAIQCCCYTDYWISFPTWELVNKMKISIRLSHDQQFTSFNVQKKFRRNSFALLWLYSRYFKIIDVSSMVYQWTVELQLTLHVSIRMYMYIVCLKESVMHVFWWWILCQSRSLPFFAIFATSWPEEWTYKYR